MKQLVKVVVATLVVMALVFSIFGCSSSAPAAPTTAPAATTAAPAATTAAAPSTAAPATSAAPATTAQTSAAAASSAPAAQGAVINLKMADWNPSMAPLCKTTQAWADMINKNTNGKVKITVYFDESLLKTKEVFRGVQTGLADIGYYVVGTDPGLLPLNEVITMPFLGVSSREQFNTVYAKLLEDPQVAKEFQGVKVLGGCAMPGLQLNLTGKEVHAPADMKGLKVIATGNVAQFAQSVGAAPMTLGPGDWASSLQKGLANGQFIHFPAAMALKTMEMYKSHTIFGDSGAGSNMDLFIINQKVWDSFTPDIQKVFIDATNWRQQEMLKVDSGQIQAGMDYIKANNHAVYTPNADEMKQWQEAAQPISKKWITDVAAKGLPAQAVYEEIQKLLK